MHFRVFSQEDKKEDATCQHREFFAVYTLMLVFV